jgi:hypothetical protein
MIQNIFTQIFLLDRFFISIMNILFNIHEQLSKRVNKFYNHVKNIGIITSILYITSLIY